MILEGIASGSFHLNSFWEKRFHGLGLLYFHNTSFSDSWKENVMSVHIQVLFILLNNIYYGI